jgi:hypothetical protein
MHHLHLLRLLPPFAPFIGATRLPAVAVVMVGHGHSPFKAPFVPLVATFNTLLGAVSGDVR